MNALVRTRGGEGYDRAAFTIADTERMVELGILPDDNSFELWDGEIVAKVTKNDPHEVLKTLLARWLYQRLVAAVWLAIEPTLRLDPKTFLEPDLLFHSAKLLPSQVRGADIFLAIEIADTSLKRDLETKASLYARYGVAHYWVLDAKRLRAFLHTGPGEQGYAEIEERDASAVLTLPFEPALSFRLADLR